MQGSRLISTKWKEKQDDMEEWNKDEDEGRAQNAEKIGEGRQQKESGRELKD